MATHVALLRGINLGGRNKVAMADLRTLVAGLGHTDVSTYIQSGNVLFTAPADARLRGDGARHHRGDRRHARRDVAGGRGDPRGTRADPRGQPVPRRAGPHGGCTRSCSASRPGRSSTVKLDAARAKSAAAGGADEVLAVGRTLYLHTPDGYGRSVLAEALLRVVSSPKSGATGTARNWATMTKLLELCDAASAS